MSKYKTNNQEIDIKLINLQEKNNINNELYVFYNPF